MNKFFVKRVESVTPELQAAFGSLMPQLTQAPVPNSEELQLLLNSSSILVVARTLSESGPIIGAATLAVFRTPSGQHAHVEDVIVDEALRGQGIGELLVDYLLLLAREIGLNGVSLTCNPRRVPANQLYKKMGFKKWETNTYWYELKN